ncbi:hypothetical protein E9230_001723 [Corynebacterium glutamicum]|nr:hypothetical protein [Corynebacterium glutamicum]
MVASYLKRNFTFLEAVNNALGTVLCLLIRFLPNDC